MKAIFKITYQALFLSLFLFSTTQAQDIFQIGDNSSVKVTGTSTLHDWESEVENTEVKLVASTENDLTTIKELEIKIEARSIKSGKDVMDIKTYNALKSTENPYITFTLKEPVTINNDQEVTAKGSLSLAGMTKDIEVTGKVNYSNEAQMGIEASYTINMPDYEIDPPSAMFGTIKTGKEVTVIFNLELTKSTVAN